MPPTRGRGGGGGKGRGKGRGGAAGAKRARSGGDDEDIDSNEDSGDEEAAQHAQFLADEDAKATAEPAAERRVRLAKEMIAAMDTAAERRANASADSSGVARGAQADAVAEALEEDAMRRSGQWRQRMASSLRGASFQPGDVRSLRGARLSSTCVSIAPDESFAVCGCKDGAIVKWDLATGTSSKMRGGRGDAFYAHEAGDELVDADDPGLVVGGGGAHGVPEPTNSVGVRRVRKEISADFARLPTGHLSDVLAVTVSSDGQLIASGGRDGLLLLWDVRTAAVVHRFKGHRGPVQALAVRRDSTAGAYPELYSAGHDRTARVWDLDQRGYVETLYGHQEAITALDALSDQCALTASEDRTVRLWRVADESQLLFANGHDAAVDAVALLHADGFVSGGQDGKLTMWSARRKKAAATVKLAHGKAEWGGPCWISALCAPTYGDVAISGSCDGNVRFWHADEEGRQLTQLCAAPVTGFVNGLAISQTGKFVCAAVGQEHRLGRWFRLPKARNGLAIIRTPTAMHTKPRLQMHAAAAMRERLKRRMERTPAEQGEEDDDEDDDLGEDEIGDDDDDDEGDDY